MYHMFFNGKDYKIQSKEEAEEIISEHDEKEGRIKNNCFMCKHKQFVSAWTAVCNNPQSKYYCNGVFPMTTTAKELVGYGTTCELFEKG